MNISISSSNIIRLATSNLSGVRNPNWEIIPHKGMQTPSKEELIHQIKELAIKRAAVTDEDFASVNYQEERLRAQYISSVSPDRKTLYKQAVNAIKKQKQSTETPLGDQTLIDYLNAHDNIGPDMKSGKPSPLACGGSVTPIHNSRGGYDYDISIGGEVVLSISQGYGPCTYILTSTEHTKLDEFNSIFDSAYNAAKRADCTKPEVMFDNRLTAYYT